MLLPHPEHRAYLRVRREVCGCEFERHTQYPRLEDAGAECPVCYNRTYSPPVYDTQPIPMRPATAPLAKFERALGHAVQDLPRPPEPPEKGSLDMISRVVWLERQMRYVQDTNTALVGGAEERLKQQDNTIKALEEKIASMAAMLDGVLAENKLRLPPPFTPE